MSIIINDNMEIRAPKPPDGRMVVDDIAQRNAIEAAYRWPGMLVYVKDTGDGTPQWQYLDVTNESQMGSNDNWKPVVSGVEPIDPTDTNAKNIIYGGAEWSGTGLIFTTSEVKYNYFGFINIIGEDQITLDDGDGEDRFDVIAVDVDNNEIIVIKGTPSNNPIFPEIGETQILLQPVLIKAHATTPEIVQSIVYRNNVEWVGGTEGTVSGTVVFNATDSPYVGSTHVRVTDCDRNAVVTFTSNSGNIVFSDYPLLSLRVRIKSSIPSSAVFTIRNKNAGANSGSAINLVNYGLDPTKQNSWQLVTLPTSLFGAGFGNGLSFKMVHGNASLQMSWDLDNIVFSDGEPPAPPSGPDLTGYVKDDGTTPFLAPQKGVDGVANDDLATVGQLPSPPDLSPYVKKDGSTPFTAPQPGVDPVNDPDLVTKKYLDDALNPVCTMGDWEAVAAAEQNSWRSVAYGDGVWVAVANNGTNRVMRSTDAGVTWSPIAAAEANSWYSVAYGNGVWVAVGDSDRVMRSVDDGQTWNAVSAAQNNAWLSVAYGDGVWVAVADAGSNSVMRSVDDGQTWNAVSAAQNNAWLSVAYGDGVWVAVAAGGTYPVIRSTDAGVTWNSVAVAEANTWWSVAYSDGVWVAVANTGTNRVMRSTDAGVTWSPIAAAEANTWRSIAYGDGVWVAVANTGTNRVMRSTDAGVTWSPIAAAEANSWYSVAYGDGVWIAVSTGGTNRVMRSVMSCPPNFVKDDGSVPFLAPQTGVPGTDPNHLATVSQLNSGGGQVDSVTGTTDEIEVDSTDPVNPIVGLAQAAKDSLALADTSLQPGDEFSGDYNDLTNKPDLTPYVKKDGSTPFTAPQVGVEGTDPDHLVTLGQIFNCGDIGEFEIVDTSATSLPINAQILITHRDILIAKSYSGATTTLYKSYDAGDTWQVATTINIQPLYITSGIKSDNTIILVTSSVVYTSTDDFETFTEVTLPMQSSHTMTYGEGMFVIMAHQGTHILSSIDGINWVSHIFTWNPAEYDENGPVIYYAGEDRFIIFNMFSLSSGPVIFFTDSDFTTFTVPTTTPALAWASIPSVFPESGIVAAVSSNDDLVISYDRGDTFVPIDFGYTHGVDYYQVTYEIVWDGTYYRVHLYNMLNNSSVGFLRSLDMVYWEIANPPTPSIADYSYTASDGIFLMNSALNEELIRAIASKCKFVKSINGEQGAITGVVKKNGSIPFTAPQTGVEGTEPNHLATVSQVTAVESLIANSLLSMIWMGTSKDFDSVTNSGFQYSFGAGEATTSTFGLPIPYAAQVTNLYIRADSQPSLEANLELWINGVPSAAKITLGTTEITTNVDVTSSNIMLQPGDFLNIKTLSGEGGGNSVVTIALRNIPA